MERSCKITIKHIALILLIVVLLPGTASSVKKDSSNSFYLKGNKYRLKVLVAYQNQTVLVKDIGTHAQYDKWKD